MKVRALKRHGYAGTMRKQGDEYFIENVKHVKLLVATKRIKIIDVETRTIDAKKVVEKAKAKVKIDVREKIKSKSSKKDDAQKSSKAKTKTSVYSRKDMTAEKNESKASKKKNVHR